MGKIEFDGQIAPSDRVLKLERGESFENTVILTSGIVCELGDAPRGEVDEERMMRWEAFGAYVGGSATLIDAGKIAGMSGPGFRATIFPEKIREIKSSITSLNQDVSIHRFGAKLFHHESYLPKREKKRREKRANRPVNKKEEGGHILKHSVLLNPKTDPTVALKELGSIKPGSSAYFRRERSTGPAILASVKKFAKMNGLSLSSTDTPFVTEYLFARGVVAAESGTDKGFFKTYNIWAVPEDNLRLSKKLIEEIVDMGGVTRLRKISQQVLLQPDTVQVIGD